MSKMKARYLGTLRCEADHADSGTRILTDAPKDNQGQGSQFSPTDLLCTSLATCKLTIMGIKAKALGIDLNGVGVGITKIMSAAPPRRVAEIILEFDWNGLDTRITPEQMESLKRSAQACPVALSLHPEVKKTLIW
jgi:putative redox protein